jgi:hypothetical protein
MPVSTRTRQGGRSRAAKQHVTSEGVSKATGGAAAASSPRASARNQKHDRQTLRMEATSRQSTLSGASKSGAAQTASARSVPGSTTPVRVLHKAHQPGMFEEAAPRSGTLSPETPTKAPRPSRTLTTATLQGATVGGGASTLTASPEGYENAEDILRMFDLDVRYGPCVGISRLERWERAQALGLEPPLLVREVLTSASGLPSAASLMEPIFSFPQRYL